MKYALTILFIHISLLTFGQINYTTVPIDLELVARDKITNLGNVKIEGNVDQSSGYDSIKVEIYRNEVLLNSVDNELTYIDSKAPFIINLSIQAELANYSFKIYGYNSYRNIYELNKIVSNVVAGDAYIIQGQSNAVASMRIGSANSNKSDFIRVYACGTPYSLNLLENNAWYIADGDVVSTSNGNSGQWGLKLARLLVDNLQIPIAIFNGAHNGQGISFFKAPLDYKTSQTSNYGRLYYRLNKTGLKNSVRGVLWSQGESNSASNYISILNYKNTFKNIENSLLIDYPNIEKFYIFQTKDVVCTDKTYDGKMNVKEAQRQLANENNEIDIMPTTSLLLSTDSCHFPFENGYESFATRIYKLVLHDIYGKTYNEEIKAPMIKSAEFIAANTLVLETDAISLKFSSTDQSTMLTRLKQDFELKNAQNAIITNVNLLGNKIIFTLSGDPGPIANISFVGYNSNIGYTITNSSNLELICFRNFPVKNFSYNGGDNSNYPIIENTSICETSGSSANISVFFPNASASYRWLSKTPYGDWIEITNLNAGTVYSNYNSPILEIKKNSTLPVSGTLYRVIANNAVLGDFTSNEALLTVDVAPVSKLITGASALCYGGSKTLTYGLDTIGAIQWQYSTSSSQENFVDIYEENGLTYTANNLEQTTWFRVMNSNGVCANDYSTAVQVVINSQPIPGYILGGNVNVCRTTNSTILSLNNYFGGIQWQKATTLTGTYSNISSATSASYIASDLTSTTYFRAVVSSGVCATQMTEPIGIFIDPLAVSKTITGASPVCIGGNKMLTYGTGSVGTIQWQYSTTSSTADFIDINGENGLTYTANNLQQTTWFRVMNTSGVCSPVYSSTVQVVVNQLPVAGYISGGDINVCLTSNSTLLSLNNSIGVIQWQKSSTLTGTYGSIASANLPTYTAASLTATSYFRAVLSSGVCTSEITSPVVINVNPSALAKTITGASPVCIGNSKTLTYGTGSVGTIQWQYSTTSSSSDFIDIYQENGLTYTANNLQQTNWFRVVNESGACPSVYSAAVQVTVNPKPVAGLIIGGDVDVCKTSNSTILSLQNYVGEIQWQKAATLTGIYSNISSATSNTYTASGLISTTYYRAVLSNGVCPSVITEPVAISISLVAEAKIISGASPICFGESKTLTYGTGSVGAIHWQYSTTSSTSGFVNIDNENGITYITNNLQQTTWFRVMNSIGICSTVYSPSVQIVVNPKPVAGTITGGNVNVCKTSNSTVLKLNNSVGAIQWQNASDVGGLPGTFSNITSANLTDYTASSLTTTTYFRVVLSSGVCTSEMTSPVVINVNPSSLAKTIIGASPVCIGGSKILTYGTGSVGTIQWQYSTTSDTAGFIGINGENVLTYTASNIQQTTWFRVMNTSGVCSPVYSLAVQVVVNPSTTPTFNQVAAICNGASLSALPTTSINGIKGTWSPALNNTLTTIYSFTSTSVGCVNTATMTITVNQKVTPTFNQVAAICNGASLSALPTTSTNGIIGTWSPTLSNTATKTYTFTPSNAVCTSTATLTVNVITTLPPSGNAIQFFSKNNPILIKDLVVVGTDMVWYSTYDNALTNTNSLESTAVVTLGNTYYVMQFLNGCVSTSPLAVTVSTNLETTDFDLEGLYFYPNPIKNYFKLIYSEIITDVQLFNTLGKSVFIAHPNTLETTLNINYLPAGMYFMELRSKDKKGVIKVIKN